MTIFKKIHLFLALSRTYHVLLDIATPAFIAILALGKIPSFDIVFWGLITAFSGYTAIYALNDLLAIQVDRLKMSHSKNYQGYAIESIDLRHPLAQKILKKWEGWLWFIAWFLISMVGAYILNPIALQILLVGTVLEIFYVTLFKLHYLRIILSGIVKTCGPLAALFAVQSMPSLFLLIAVFCWVFLWEIGGQNIPADWNDMDEDKKVNAKTFPTQYGLDNARKVILISSAGSIIFSLEIMMLSPIVFSWIFWLMAILIGFIFFVGHALALYISKKPFMVSRLFNWASYYPLALLVMICIRLILH